MGIEGNQESLGVGMGTRLLAGGGAGITAALLTYPLDLVRTRLAAQVSLPIELLVPNAPSSQLCPVFFFTVPDKGDVLQRHHSRPNDHHAR